MAAPGLTAAVAYGVLALVWVAVGVWVPRGRWLAVHLFTLGMLTNAVLTFTDHFARTLTRSATEDPAGRWRRWWLANLGTVAVLVGLPTDLGWLVGVGATVVSAAVVLNYLSLRRLRRSALGARFAWVVRLYERAHGAFLHGALLGLLMGVGALSGRWYGTARLAHLHINLGGWGLGTLLATLVFFGPTMTRSRIREGADALAVRWLRPAVLALNLAVILLLVSAVGGVAGTALRVAAGAGLGVFAAAAVVVCAPALRAAGAGVGSSARPAVVAVLSWLPAAVAADAVVVGAGRWWVLDAVGLAVIVGVLAQAIVATLTYLAPLLRGRDAEQRRRIELRLGRGAVLRTLLWNGGVGAAVAAAVLRGSAGAVLARAGWAAVAAALVWVLVAATVPLGGPARTVS